jgi:hypothetical protein
MTTVKHSDQQAKLRLMVDVDQTEAHIQTLHVQALARLRPHLDAFAHELREKQATLDEDEKVPLSWLHENNRLNALKRAIADEFNHFSIAAQLATGQAVQRAKQQGEHAAQAQLQASVPEGVVWHFRKARETS